MGTNHKSIWGAGYHQGKKDSIKNQADDAASFENLLGMINDTQMVINISNVVDTAYASKLWLKDNFGTDFTATDTMKLTEMILKNNSV